jgi:DNA-binding transcriptional ArsR family regulator
MKAANSLKKIFVSSTRRKLIQILFQDPQEMYYVRQLVRMSKEEINSVRRELDNLKQADLIRSEVRGNRLYYSVNQNSEIFPELVSLSSKMSLLARSILDKKNLIGKIKWVLGSPQFIAHLPPTTPSQVDLIIIGQISLKEIASIIKQEEERQAREINYMVMDKSELKLRKTKRDPFIVDFFLNCPQIIIGNALELSAI